MGQRLVVQIEDCGKQLANAYYHWSAYTGSALEIANDVIQTLNEIAINKTNIERAVHALYKTGARISDLEVSWMKDESIETKEFEYAFGGEKTDRNKGLLSVSKKGMDESYGWAEGDVVIDIGYKCVNFGVMFSCPVDELEEDLTNAPVFHNYDDEMHEIPFDQWENFYNELNELLKISHFAISEDGEYIYEFIC